MGIAPLAAAPPSVVAERTRIPSNRHDGYTARMNRRLALASAVFAIVLPLALSGCGNKGPLVLPQKPDTVPTQDPSSPTEPVDAASTDEVPASTAEPATHSDDVPPPPKNDGDGTSR